MSGIIESIEKAQLKEHVDQFNVGDTVRVYGKIKEGNRERTQAFEGVIIAKKHVRRYCFKETERRNP